MKNNISICLLLLIFLSFSSYGSSKQKAADVPVDCPLKKQGINAHGMKPFEEVEKYIEFLEKKDRHVWQKPDEVISTLGLKGSETIADIGAGSGYFTFRFSKALPRGKVIAVDVEPAMLRHIHHKARSSGIKNIEVLHASYDDPCLPGNIDLVFMCDVLHHIKNRPAWLSKLNAGMKKSAKLVLIEFKEGKIPEGPPASIKISSKETLSILVDAGFKLVRQELQMLPYQYYYEFIKD